MRETRIPIAICLEISAVGLPSRGAQIYISLLAEYERFSHSSAIKVKIIRSLSDRCDSANTRSDIEIENVLLAGYDVIQL